MIDIMKIETMKLNHIIIRTNHTKLNIINNKKKQKSPSNPDTTRRKTDLYYSYD